MPERPPDHANESNGETSIHSFVVRLWKEESESEKRQTGLRGHITHIPSGQRRYIKELEGILFFIIPYLEKMNVHAKWTWRLRNWLSVNQGHFNIWEQIRRKR